MKFPFTILRQKLSVMTFKLVTLHNFLRDILSWAVLLRIHAKVMQGK